MIFGLALSIGAVSLLSSKPSSITGLALSLLGFGFAFYILASVWMTYTRIMSVLPVETGSIIGITMLLLFLVSVEPYLYSLINLSWPLHQGPMGSGTTTALWALDMGSIYLIIGYFSNQLAKEERKLVPKEMLRRFKLLRNAAIITTAIFFVSVLPIFWTYGVYGIPLRFFLWMGIFILRPVRRELETKSTLPAVKQ
jgi:uncharacterized membrane protein